jgi:hypothetical protein
MKEFSESYCLAILIANLKHRNRYPDPITIADCARYLYKNYGSYEKIAEMVGVHSSVIRKWVKLSNAPATIRDLVKEGKMYPVAAFAILAAFPDDDKKMEFAAEVVGWGEPEIVRLIRYVKKNPSLPVSECKKLLIAKAMDEMLDNRNNRSSINENEQRS